MDRSHVWVFPFQQPAFVLALLALCTTRKARKKGSVSLLLSARSDSARLGCPERLGPEVRGGHIHGRPRKCRAQHSQTGMCPRRNCRRAYHVAKERGYCPQEFFRELPL